MTPGRSQPVINNPKGKKKGIRRDKKKPKHLKTVCGSKPSIKTALNSETLSRANQDILKLSPFVRLERLKFDITGPVSLSKLSIPAPQNNEISKSPQKEAKIKVKPKDLNSPVTENNEIRKSPQKETKMKKKPKNLNLPSSFIKKKAGRPPKKFNATSSVPPKNAKLIKKGKLCRSNSLKLSHAKRTAPQIFKEPKDTLYNQGCFKNAEHFYPNKNCTSTDDENPPGTNSASVLNLNEKMCSKTEDKDFFGRVLKAKPIIKGSDCKLHENSLFDTLYDIPNFTSAFKFYKWHKKRSNLAFNFVSTNMIPDSKLSISNHPDSEADISCNEVILPSDLFQAPAEVLSLSVANYETVASTLDLASNNSECDSIRKISVSSIDTDTGSLSGSKLCLQFHRRNSQHEAAASFLVDNAAQFSNGVEDYFQNDNDLQLKICDVRGNCSYEAMQTSMEDSDQMNMLNGTSADGENKNLCSFSNYEQDNTNVEQYYSKPTEQSCESLEGVRTFESKRSDSNQHFNIPLNYTEVIEENNAVTSVENCTSHNRDVLPSDKDAVCIQATLDVMSQNEVQNNADLTVQANDISVAADEPSPHSVESDKSESEQASYTKVDEQNSNSRGFYELNDELDYEPSEASEPEVSETESCHGEVEANQNHSDPKILVQGAHAFECNGSDNNVSRDSFTVEDSVLTEQDQPDVSSNTTENSPNKNSLESVPKNDTFIKQAACHYHVNDRDKCEALQSNSHDQADSIDADVSEPDEGLLSSSSKTSNSGLDEGIHDEASEARSPITFSEQKMNCYQKQHVNKARRSQKGSIDSEDDSESDSEHSFKRKSSNDNQASGNIQEENLVNGLSQNEMNSFLMKLEDVLNSIENSCKNRKLEGALQIAEEYLPISDNEVQMHIFTKLFFCAMDTFRDSDHQLEEDLCLNTMTTIMGFFYDLNLYKTELCRDVLIECLDVRLTSPFGHQLFAFCQKNDILFDSDTVRTYLNFAEPSNMSLNELISFLKFVLKCNISCPKALLKGIWNRLFQEEADPSPSVIAEICELLLSADSPEVDKEDLKTFVKLCFEKRSWTQIARLICGWVKKRSLIASLIDGVLCQLQDFGSCYKELAKEIFDPNVSVPEEAAYIFGQMGVCFLMEASSKKLYGLAFQVLTVLHQHNIDYLSYQAPMYSAVSYIKSIPRSPDQIFVFPFSVAFTALDICLHLERPKDAFMIFNSFSLYLPQEFDEILKLEIRSRRFHHLLKITSTLQPKDPLGLGMQALRSLLTIAQEDFTLEQLNDYSNEIQAAYNKYMVSILNSEDEDLIKELYCYTYGPLKEPFALEHQVLRGLVVFFMKQDATEEAYKLFRLAYSKDIYELTKKTPPWEMTVLCDWTSEEIKLSFLKFVKALIPLSRSKTKAHDFGEFYSVKLIIKDVTAVEYEVDCLKECRTITERVCGVLKDLDLQWKVGEAQVDLIPENFYYFFASKYQVPSVSAQVPSENFKVPNSVCVLFGKGAVPQKSSVRSSAEPRLDQEDILSGDSSYSSPQNAPQPHTFFSNSTSLVNVSHMLSNDDSSPRAPSQVQSRIPSDIIYDPLYSSSRSTPLLPTFLSYNTSLDNVSHMSSNDESLPSTRGGRVSSTPPLVQRRIPSDAISYSMSPKTVATSPSPRKSSSVSPRRMGSPPKQKMSSRAFSPGSTVDDSFGMALPNATFEDTNQDYASRFDSNVSPQTSGIKKKLPPKKSHKITCRLKRRKLSPRRSPDYSTDLAVSNANFENSDQNYASSFNSSASLQMSGIIKKPPRAFSPRSSTGSSFGMTVPKTTLGIKKELSSSRSSSRSSHGAVSPLNQKLSPLKNRVDISLSMAVPSTSFEDTDQNLALDLDSSAPTQTEDITESSLNDSGRRISPKAGLNEAKTVSTSTKEKFSSTLKKKPTIIRRRHPSFCLKHKNTSISTVLKAKTKASKLPPDLKNIKITLQSPSEQGNALRIVKPLSEETTQTEISNPLEPSTHCNVPEDVFQKITTFLRSKVMWRRKDLSGEQQQRKALSLAHAFVRRNVVDGLDKRTMKLLNDYSDECV